MYASKYHYCCYLMGGSGVLTCYSLVLNRNNFALQKRSSDSRNMQQLFKPSLTPINIKVNSCPSIINKPLSPRFISVYILKLHNLLKYKMKNSIWKVYSTVSSSSGICMGVHTGFSAMPDWESWKQKTKPFKKLL